MKCPFRKQFIPQVTGETEEHYMECYRDECPFFVPETQFGNLIVQEHCARGDKK